jgi:hypothetical protein
MGIAINLKLPLAALILEQNEVPRSLVQNSSQELANARCPIGLPFAVALSPYEDQGNPESQQVYDEEYPQSSIHGDPTNIESTRKATQLFSPWVTMHGSSDPLR